ncbi:amidohydrolase family protein [Litchfieldella qijiaojingensis]|uniref:amidohydrolase family protein n=1 Tax=Litchfieldella qijiaojingensis TaxID=980347 RepID=UPI001678489A|nr:amidohydrolase family protein [Halomonas qijiaojingensis]
METIPANTRPLGGPAPQLKAPPGATDCHIHIYLPGYGSQPSGPRIPELATVDDYREVQKRLSLERVVVTQSNAYQTDNRVVLEAVEELGIDNARAVIAVTPHMQVSELEVLHQRGVRGARIMNLPGGAVKIDQLLEVERLVRQVGWHLMVQFNGREIHDHVDTLHRIQTDYIIDHIGKFMGPVAPDDSRVDEILRLMDRGNAWVKICGAYETSLLGGPCYEDVAPIARRIISHAPDRIIWGSNWPHVGVSREYYPDDAEQLDVLLKWAGPTVRQRILVDNPAVLYGFR